MRDTSQLKPLTAWEEPSNSWADVAAIDFTENLDTKESRHFEKLLDDGTIVRQSPKLHRYWWLTPQDQTVIITISQRRLATRLWNNITGKNKPPFGHHTNYITRRETYRPVNHDTTPNLE